MMISYFKSNKNMEKQNINLGSSEKFLKLIKSIQNSNDGDKQELAKQKIKNLNVIIKNILLKRKKPIKILFVDDFGNKIVKVKFYENDSLIDEWFFSINDEKIGLDFDDLISLGVFYEHLFNKIANELDLKTAINKNTFFDKITNITANLV